MSRTIKRNGIYVQDAVLEVGKGRVGNAAYVTVKEVARQAGVSKPTARKYMNMLVTAGWLERAVMHTGHAQMFFLSEWIK